MNNYAKPKTILFATILLCISLAIMLAPNFLQILHNGLHTHYQASMRLGVPFQILLYSLSVIIPFFIIFKINRGKNWARCIYFITYSFGLFCFIFSLILTSKGYLIHNYATMIESATIYTLGLASLLLLFSKDANPWFIQDKQASSANA
jgi:hypothetical protein